jgi:hypothetical protein
MASAAHFVAKAELDARVLRDHDPEFGADRPSPADAAVQARARLRERIAINLSTARGKIAEASSRLEAATAGS